MRWLSFYRGCHGGFTQGTTYEQRAERGELMFIIHTQRIYCHCFTESSKPLVPYVLNSRIILLQNLLEYQVCIRSLWSHYDITVKSNLSNIFCPPVYSPTCKMGIKIVSTSLNYILSTLNVIVLLERVLYVIRVI